MNKMKKMMLASAIATAIASPAALADYHIYGKANVGILNNDPDGGTSNTNLHSFASRIGVKGKTELTDTLDAVYQWETEVDLTGSNTGKGEVEDETTGDVSEGKTSLLKARNQFLGLKGGFGTLIAGIHDTPMKNSEGKIDLFSDVVDMARVQDPYMDTQEREKDYVGYYSPKFNNLQFMLATMPGKSSDKELFHSYSTALVYGDKKLKKTNFFGAIAYDKGIDETEDATAIRVSGSTKFGALKLGALYEQADTKRAGAESQDRYVVSGAYKLAGHNTLKLQYAASEDANNGSKEVAGSSDITLGLSHKLGKHTSIWDAVNKGTDVKGVAGKDETNFVVGVVHQFKL